MLSVLCCLAVAGLAAAAGPGIKTKPGELVIDPPTLINLGFEWFIDGDDNRNASVEVSYRKQGETPWKTGLPLLRLQGERIYQRRASSTSSRRTCLPAASSISSRTPPTKRGS